MQNFTFHNPTKICFGTDQISNLDQLIDKNARVMILLGGASAEKNGTLAEVTTALAARYHVTFKGIEPNPSYETLMQAVTLAKEQQIDFLLAVGGGSVIDGTKFVAAAINFPEDPWSILTTGAQTLTSALPFGTVLTLPATGSEMNCGSVITRRETKTKLPFMHPLVFPKFSILDPTKTYTLPPRQVANGLVDAFVHILEQYLTYPTGAAVQDRFAEGLLQTLIELGPKTLTDTDDYESRANLMWVATLALNGLIGAGVPQDWSTHMIGHELTALYEIDHARTLAIVLPALLDHQRDTKQQKLLQYATRVWSINEGSDAERIDSAIAKTRAFFESLDVETTLTAFNLDHDAVDDIVAQLEKHGMTALGEHADIDLSASRRILNNCF